MKVLVAEDDPVSRRMLEAFLTKWGYEVILAADGAEAWRLLQGEHAPSLAILDWMMPGLDGVQVCQKVRERAEMAPHPYVYILLVTAKGQKQDVVEGIDAGADDYLSKPFNVPELRARLRAGRRILDLHEELVSAREVLRIQASHDPLTGLWNHGAIFDIMQREFDRAERERNPLGVVMADVDHFKLINDTLGHLAGDAVLREVASRMRHAVRPYDSVGRYGGEEFLILVPGCNTHTAVKQAERLREAISGQPIVVNEGVVTATLSLGVAAKIGAAKLDCDSLLRAADTALYRAKRNGRNRVEAATEQPSEKEALAVLEAGFEA